MTVKAVRQTEDDALLERLLALPDSPARVKRPQPAPITHARIYGA